MKFKVLASGSKGNMIYIETKEVKLLLDCGISYSNAKEKLREDDVNIDDVNIILCSHEHTDHTKELAMHMKKIDPILYINKKSYSMLKPKTLEELELHNIKFIDANKIYNIKDLSIYTLQMSHDSINCIGFVFKENDNYLAHLTDTGLIHVDYFPILRKCSSVIIEANHNVEMLQESNRPIDLKRRILSVKGHMSNQITCKVLSSILNGNQKNVILAHVSEDCNSDECLTEEIIDVLKDKHPINYVIARQKEALDLMEV